MKKIILLSFLFSILSCSNDNDLTTLEDFTPTEISNVSINISQMDGFTIESCPDIEDSSFLIKENSLISGFIGKYGKLEESTDNTIVVYSCILSPNKDANFVTQRFGGVFITTSGEAIYMEAIIDVNRLTHEIYGSMTIDNPNNTHNSTENHQIKGYINESGSCTIVGR